MTHPEPKMHILEAMSLIYEIAMKKEEYKIATDSDFYQLLLRSYNDLQLLRDDSMFVGVEVDLNDKFIKKMKQKRIDELTSPPFGAAKDAWMR